MKVEIWSDVVCSFCYMGKRHMEEGLKQFEHADQVKIEYRSFQLDPNADKDPDYNIIDYLVKKGYTREQALAGSNQIAAQAKTVGLDFQTENVIPANSTDAHRLIKFAGEFGKKSEVAELLYKAFFSESKHIGKFDTLADIAAEAGIDREQAIQMLESSKYVNEVQEDLQEAASKGIRAVPHYVINGKYSLSGVQTGEVFRDLLQKAWEEEQPLTDIEVISGAACEDGFCAVKEHKHS